MAPKKDASDTLPFFTVDDIISAEWVSDPFIVTHEMSEILIERNELNRPISDIHVDDLGDQMKRNKWRRNGEAIIISTEGMVLDGQHRLWASFKFKKSFETIVTRGVSKETFATIDTGKKRSGGDALVIYAKMRGLNLTYTSQLSAAITTCIEIQNNIVRLKGSRTNKITRQDLINFLEKNGGLITWIERARVKKTWAASYASSIAAICYLTEKNGYEMKAIAFMHGFMTGENLDGRSPIMALRNRLGTDKRMKKVDRLNLIIHALNKYIDDEPLTILKVIKGDMTPLHEPPKKTKSKGDTAKS